MDFKSSFPPIISADAKVLILGSLPGDLSLLQQQYYGHPQNRFWKLMHLLFEEELSGQYEDRKRLLLKNGVALWDVCATAIRPGSMDSDISEVQANAIPELLATYPGIKRVFFNGQKAMALHDKLLKRVEGVEYIGLPSTSPANARFHLALLKEHWAQIL
ncbi:MULTISPECIES: DNA-deoxyinosine glycosylase [Sphingobacterium]|uniref:DNA-deoxyinosine glycosylase n=1 Tax=Sphingobacterium hotanense TaxID=649196 RepID=A0ABT7NQQ5_9SPHI|nr:MULTISPECIES: DNA-deoxyinosine glycosylase [Sphingobacterium]MDM1049586.1 DNA-deoxyinosine glycosylase [Sphingobacterium hotanense]